jgi:heme-degrading monooxygenase HmoA
VSAAPFELGQVVTIFRSRLLDDPDDGYEELNAAMQRRAHELGGLVEVKSFEADDGERVTLVTFQDRTSHERWADDPVHRRAQSFGRSKVYSSYCIQVTDCTRVATYEAPES